MAVYNGIPGWAGPANTPQVNVPEMPASWVPGTQYNLPGGKSVIAQSSISDPRPVYPWRGTSPGQPTYAQQLAEWEARQNARAASQAAGGVATGGAGGAVTPGNLQGAPPFSYAGAYGGIPQVPSPQATQTAAVTGNISTLPVAEQLATQTNAFNIGQAPSPYIANLPNYQNILREASGGALSLAKGELPADVVYQLGQAAAERGAGVGAAPGSPNTNAAYLKALGLNSLQAKQTGLNQFGQLMSLTPTAPLLNPATMFTTPEEWQAAQMAANLYRSAPIPAEKAAADLAALQRGVGQGRGSVGSPAVGGYNAPARTPIITPPTFTANAAPTAPGRMVDPNAYTSSTVQGEPAYPGADASLDEIYNWLGIGGEGEGDTGSFPGSPDYGQVPGFESLYEDFATP